MLRIHHLCLDRDGDRVLDDLSAMAPVGQLTVLLGPNGAGKSSLLAAAAGELAPASGTIEFNGQSFIGARPAALARRRALLPQQSTLDFDFTVREIAALGATPFPAIPPAEVQKLCDSVMRLVDAAALADRRYLALSGGERQRVQLARVLVQACAAAALGPALLLLDEPTASLDPRHQHLLLAGLHQLCRSVPLTIVASLHDINLALHYADQAWLLHQGRLVAAGAPTATLTPDVLTAVFELPSRRVAGQIVFGLPTL